MKKIFKKSILIVICFILGSIVCISIGVYAYSYSATDIEYTSGKSVKQAMDELYTSAELIDKINSGKALHVESENLASNGDDQCNQEKEGCVCYYLNKYTNGTWEPTNTKFSYGIRDNCVIKKAIVYAGYTSFGLAQGATLDITYNGSNWHASILGIRCAMTIECDLPRDFYRN